MVELVGREVKTCGERLQRLRPLCNSSITAAWTGNQSTAALSADAGGPAPATMYLLSAALKDASLFNNKFGDVWIPSLDHILVQRCNHRAASIPPCFVRHEALGRCACVCDEDRGVVELFKTSSRGGGGRTARSLL